MASMKPGNHFTAISSTIMNTATRNNICNSKQSHESSLTVLFLIQILIRCRILQLKNIYNTVNNCLRSVNYIALFKTNKNIFPLSRNQINHNFKMDYGILYKHKNSKISDTVKNYCLVIGGLDQNTSNRNATEKTKKISLLKSETP